MTGGGAKLVINDMVYGNGLVASYPSSNSMWSATGKALSANTGDEANLTVYVLGIQDITYGSVFSNNIIWTQDQTLPCQDPLSSVTTPNVMSCGGAQAFFTSGTGSYLASSFPSSSNCWRTESHAQIDPTQGTIVSYIVEISAVTSSK